MRAPSGLTRAGFSLIELLVAGAVLVVALGIATSFFAQQAQLQRTVQARNALQDGVRVATQIVTQDLALAGNPLVVTAATGSIRTGITFPGCFSLSGGGSSCLVLTDDSVTASTLRLRYVSSQFPDAQACRDVTYTLTGDGVLQRSDVVCGGTFAPVDLLTEVAAFKVITVCSTGTRYEAFPTDPPEDCGEQVAYPRVAIVSIGAVSRPVRSSASPAMEIPTSVQTSTPPIEYGSTSVPCPTGRACFSVTEETLLPNLKDR